MAEGVSRASDRHELVVSELWTARHDVCGRTAGMERRISRRMPSRRNAGLVIVPLLLVRVEGRSGCE